MKKTIKLKELAELLGVGLREKMLTVEGTEDSANGYNTCKAEYDNLEIPIEKLLPSIKEIEECLFEKYNGRDMSNSKDIAQAIHNLKPRGGDISEY